MQLFGVIFSTFCGKKKIIWKHWKHCSVRTEKLHRKKVKKKNFIWEEFFFRKTSFFRAKNKTVIRRGPMQFSLYCSRCIMHRYLIVNVLISIRTWWYKHMWKALLALEISYKILQNWIWIRNWKKCIYIIQRLSDHVVCCL